MPKISEICPISFPALVQSTQKTIADARIDIHHRLVVMYWIIGRHIAGYLAAHPDEMLTGLSRRLSSAIQIHERTLQHCHQFFSVYPKLDHNLAINWSQYRCLLGLPSDKDRRYWEKRILKEHLNQKQLLGLLKETFRQPSTVSSDQRLAEPIRGLLHHYRLVSTNHLNGKKSFIMIDCGFQNRIEPPPSKWTLINKRVVRSEKNNGQYQIKITKETTDKIYTFAACIERIIDGDTLLADIDCGFSIWSRQRLRLKSINSPELDTVAGQQAKQFVEQELSTPGKIVIRTSKDPEKYGRYLADIFYLKNCADAQRIASEGHHLNQILLDKGLAQIYRETKRQRGKILKKIEDRR